MFNFSDTTDVHCQVVGRLVAGKTGSLEAHLPGPISRPVVRLKNFVPCLLGTVMASVFL